MRTLIDFIAFFTCGFGVAYAWCSRQSLKEARTLEAQLDALTNKMHAEWTPRLGDRVKLKASGDMGVIDELGSTDNEGIRARYPMAYVRMDDPYLPILRYSTYDMILVD